MKRVKVPGPNPQKENVVGYYEYVSKFCLVNFGCEPSRTTLHKYLRRGYPIMRGGPYVAMPVFMALKRPMTTVEAMERFLQKVRSLEKRHGVPSLVMTSAA